jgi:hypothetical protein
MAGRRYVRDAKGRFASKGVGGIGGYQGQTSGEGARLKTKGHVREGGGSKRSLKTSGQGVIAKPKGLAPQSSRSLRTGVAVNRLNGVNARMGTRPDTAAQNIPMSGSRGRALDRDISRSVSQQKAAARTADRARNSKFKTEQSRAKKLRDAHVGAIAQAKGLPKSQVEAALKAQTPSTQIKALKNWVKQNRTAKPAAAPAPTSTGRQRVRGNFRPQNLYSGTNRSAAKGYGTDAAANVREARRRIEASGAQSALKSNKRSRSVASVNEKTPNKVDVNASHSAWKNPRADMIQSRRKNEFSTSSPNHYVAHELGHIRNPSSQMAKSWDTQLRGKGQIYADADKVLNAKRTARRVSRYAMTQPAEFAAEVSAGLSLGKKYDSRVMRQYRQVNGRRARSLRSQLKNK